MSKTIEVASIHKGNIATKVKGESVTVKFKETDTMGVFLALCDNDVAGAFLSIGRPDYWKPGINADIGDDGDSDNENDADGDDVVETVAQVVAKIQEVTTIEELEALLTGEERKGVLRAAEKRSKELTK